MCIEGPYGTERLRSMQRGAIGLQVGGVLLLVGVAVGVVNALLQA